MVQTLIVLNSSYVGSRDLWWADDELAVKGYNVYRAFDYPINWTKLNANPWSGHFYRDQVTLQQVSYIVKDSDWRDKGVMGRWGFQIPDTPYADVVTGRPYVSNNPDNVQVFLDGVAFAPAEVQGLDRTVWLEIDNSIKQGGYVSGYAPVNDGVVWKADYSAVQEFKVVYNKLVNYVDIYSGMTRTFYTVVPIGVDGAELHAPGERGTKIVNTQEVDQMTWEYAEMIRRNNWVFEQVGEPAYILFRKTRGEFCGCRGSETGLGQPRAGCRSCFEIGYVGGYYGPFDITFIDPDTAITRELDEGGGVKSTRESRSYLTNTPIVQDGDIIVRRNGDRMVIHGVVYKQPRGILLQQDFTVELLKWGDFRYLIPINTGLPTLFNPVISENPLQGIDPNHLIGDGEPLFDASVQPGKAPWENKAEIPIGRTVAFGRIMT